MKEYKDLESLIKENMKEDKADDFIHDCISIFYYVRIPFFLSHSIVNLNKDKILKDKLRVYQKEGTYAYGDKDSKEAMKFKWVMKTNVLHEFSDDSELYKEKFIKQMEECLSKVLLEKQIVHNVFGYCDKCEDCQGHICGTVTYYIDDVCLYDFKSNMLTVING